MFVQHAGGSKQNVHHCSQVPNPRCHHTVSGYGAGCGGAWESRTASDAEAARAKLLTRSSHLTLTNHTVSDG